MTVEIKFNLDDPENGDTERLHDAMHGTDYHNVIIDLDESLRAVEKYGAFTDFVEYIDMNGRNIDQITANEAFDSVRHFIRDRVKVFGGRL